MKFPKNAKFDDVWPLLEQNVDQCIIPDTMDIFNYAPKIRIAQVRIFYGVPKTVLAKMIGTSYRQYLRYETGSSVLPVGVLTYLSYFYNLSMDFLTGISDKPGKVYPSDPVLVNGFILTEHWQTAEPQEGGAVCHFAPGYRFPCFRKPLEG